MEVQYKVEDGNPLQVLGEFEVTVELNGKAGEINLKVIVTNVPQQHLLSRQAMVELGLSDLAGHFMQHTEGPKVHCRRPANSCARSFRICLWQCS